MAVITTPPRGLLGLLGLRDYGGVPSDLGAQVLASIDVTQFLMLNRETIYSTPVASGGTVGWKSFRSAGMSVPPGEIWYVHEFSIEASLGAGISAHIQPGYAESDSSYTVIGLSQNATAGELLGVYASDPDRWAVPGGFFLAYVRSNTGGSFNMTATAIITRIKV